MSDRWMNFYGARDNENAAGAAAAAAAAAPIAIGREPEDGNMNAIVWEEITASVTVPEVATTAEVGLGHEDANEIETGEGTITSWFHD